MAPVSKDGRNAVCSFKSVDPCSGLFLDTTRVMAGLVPAIHALFSRQTTGVDARDKPGHDRVMAGSTHGDHGSLT
jgi:hypothetical protein